jgi:hypothetical protein
MHADAVSLDAVVKLSIRPSPGPAPRIRWAPRERAPSCSGTEV